MIEIGTFVRYNNSADFLDIVIGIVENSTKGGEKLFVQWTDGFAAWYPPFALIKL